MRWPGRLIASAFVAASCLAAAPAKADAVIYDTITGRTMDNAGVWTGYSSSLDASSTVGVQFIATVGGAISQVKLAANGYSSGWLYIYSDNNGAIGTKLETLALTESIYWNTFATSGFAPYELLSGTSYWAVLTGQPNNWYGMVGDPYHQILSEAQTQGQVAFVGGGKIFDLTVNEPIGLQISVVPEPSTWAMLLLGFGAIGAMTWRRRLAEHAAP